MVEGPDTSKADEVIQTKNEVPKKRSKDEKQLTKVVVRRLPGTMTEQSFLEHVSPLFEHDYFYFVQGENPLLGENSFSRAYINFVNVEDVFTFTMKFDDYVFLDDTGQEFPAVVEFAPFQRIPKHKSNRKNDSLCGTIKDDPDYQEFVRQLESEEQEHKPNQLTEHYFDLANDENEEKVTTTPLLEFLAWRKNESIKYKEEKKEERRRRDLERRKLKEENRRVRKENKDASKVQQEKITKKEEKTKDSENKSPEDSKYVVPSRLRKSYQEERQRDLARRKHEEKSLKSGDGKESKDHVGSSKQSDQSEDVSGVKTDLAKDEKKTDRDEKTDHDYKRRYDDKKTYRGDERRSSYTREWEERKSFHGVKKREFANGYEYDGKFKRESHHFEDYKTRNHSSHQKSGYSAGKYSSGKNKDYEDTSTKKFDSKKKYDSGDFKDTKKNYQWEKERKSSESTETDKSNVEPKVAKKEPEGMVKGEDRTRENKVKPSSKNESATESEAKVKESRNDDKKDDRAERRIKNKDRPALEIYRPGMGKFSRQRLERNKSTDSKDGD